MLKQADGRMYDDDIMRTPSKDDVHWYDGKTL